MKSEKEEIADRMGRQTGKKGMKVSFRTAAFTQKGKALAFDKRSFLIDPLLLALSEAFSVGFPIVSNFGSIVDMHQVNHEEATVVSLLSY